MSKKKLSHQEECRRAVGKCPGCGRIPEWFNDVPLRAFCWGTDENPHQEMSCVVPGVAQPYKACGKQVPPVPLWKTEVSK